MTFLRSESADQFVKFCLVGIVNTAVNYSMFLVLYRINEIPYVAAATAGFMLGAFSGFFLNRSWTFRAHELAAGKGLLMYLAAQVLSLGGHMATLLSCTELLGAAPELSNVLGICVSTFINFSLSKFFVFGKRAPITSGN